MGAIAGILVAVVVLGIGIFVGARFFFHNPEPPPAPVVTPKPKPKPPPPGQTGNSSGQPGTPQPGQPEDIKPMSADQLFARAREASSAKDFRKAIVAYQEILQRDKLNPQALQGLSDARAELNRQDQENIRNEKFLRDYQSAVAAFQEQDYAESLRISWRLIYPDDTLARQLGKREAVSSLIRAGYYNWAVMNLKSENLNDAEKNVKDLIEFEKGDPEGQRLQQFIKTTRTRGVDQTYRETARNLQYRTFSESP
jgi:tetratricopeptide (TPR) repeat protein